MTVDVTLIIPCYMAEKYISTCLHSVIAQTMNRENFEVIIVVNGPIDESPRIAKELLSDEHNLNWRIIYEDLPSLSNARNVGIDHARGSWVTWVDVDDWLSPNFLEELISVAKPGVVPLAKVVDVDERSLETASSPISEQMLEVPAGAYEPEKLWRSLGFAACKLLPIAQAKAQQFDVDLRSGEDVAYFAPLFSRYSLKFDNTPAHEGATYFRLVRPGSMSRQTASFDFSINQRLSVMKHLDAAARTAEPAMKTVMYSMMRSQTLFAKRYLDDHPEDLHQVVEAVDRVDLSYYPWNLLAGKSNHLAISYNFSPFADASAVVAAKRIANSGVQWNVINNDMTGIRERDNELHEKMLPYISTQRTIKNPAIFGSWRGIQEFCRDGMAAISDIETSHGPQTTTYSRSMWPASHYLAAIYKLRNPGIEWTAEFSDPLRKDVQGKERFGPIVEDAIWTELKEGLAHRGFDLRLDESLFAVCEKIAYALADKIYFTNPHQKHYMLSYLDDDALKVRANSVATICPQPAPPKRFLNSPATARQLSKAGTIRIGFFGSFYPNRGPGTVLDALRLLPNELVTRVELNIFSPAFPGIEELIGGSVIENCVILNPPVPYLLFLEEAAKMDVLLVNDTDTASTGRRLNPYLPSKLSDYRSVRRPIWGMYEPGSVLSRANLSYLCRANDVYGASEILRRIIEETT